MQAFVLQKNTTAYEHLLKANQCLTIRNPSMGENCQKVKYVHSSLKINLNDNTNVEACNEPVGAEWEFDFSPFDSFVDDPDDDDKSFKSPIDVIGFVVKCLPSEDKSEHNNGKDEKKTTFILEDLHFLALLTASTSSGYSGLSSSAIKSTTGEYLFDVFFSTIGALSEISEVLLQLFIVLFIIHIIFSFQNVLNYLLCIQQKFIIILGTIKSFASEDSWFYNACKSCNKKVLTNTIFKDKQDVSEGYDEVTVLECQTDRCNKRTVVSVPRIKVLIRVQDCTGIITLTLFEREVVKLLKVNANQLLDKNIEPADDELLNAVPSDSNATVNFHVKDSVSRTGDEDTPVSNLSKSMFTTPSAPEMNCSVKMLENELKRNLDAVYEPVVPEVANSVGVEEEEDIKEMVVSEDLSVDGENQDMDYEEELIGHGHANVAFQQQHVLEDDIVNVEHDVPVFEADPLLEPKFVDVPQIPAVVDQANQYELTWCLSFRFRFPKAFVANVYLSVLDEMVVETKDGFSMTLEMRQETARGRPRYALRGWQNFMLQAGLENGAQFLMRYDRNQNTLQILNPNP
ncbi:putative transcription factor B3-Domain family [Helianthus annuus]|nr:putative transcription factor B3-Domain family [Helianthus annuus]